MDLGSVARGTRVPLLVDLLTEIKSSHSPWRSRARGYKPQASSNKLDSWFRMCYYRIIKEKYMDNENLKRIADALEEILRLVKEDMERMKKIND